MVLGNMQQMSLIKPWFVTPFCILHLSCSCCCWLLCLVVLSSINSLLLLFVQLMCLELFLPHSRVFGPMEHLVYVWVYFTVECRFFKGNPQNQKNNSNIRCAPPRMQLCHAMDISNIYKNNNETLTTPITWKWATKVVIREMFYEQ